MMRAASQLTLPLLCAVFTIVAVHGFMHWLDVPSQQALILGTIIDAALILVLFSRWSFVEKLRIYLVFIVMFVVGGNTLCGCTGAELFAASGAGIMTFVVVGILKIVLQNLRLDSTKKPETEVVTRE